MSLRACFFVTHGSSNPRSWQFLQQLVLLAQSQVDALIGGGCLEGLELSLAEQLQSFGEVAKSQNYTEIEVVPLFLLAGVHVKEDMIAEVAIAQTHFSDSLYLKITPHLGTHPKIQVLMHELYAQFDTESKPASKPARILVSHGSRRAGANHPIESLAKNLGAIAAYWSISPNLETQIELLISQGIKNMTILPYFLSEGHTTEAIRQKISSYPQLNINLTRIPILPLQIIDLALDMAEISQDQPSD
jgi:sirohydrochlorin cobaltochelatase